MATPQHLPPPLAQQFLDTASRLLVIPEDHESAISDVRDALNALSWLGDELANANLQRRQLGLGGYELNMPPAAFSGLMRVLHDRLVGIDNNPSLSLLLRQRPELCDERSPK